jgi:bacterioferritin (cytochrome b1)
MSAPGAFLSDIKEIRRRAREHLSEGAVTKNYGGKVEDARDPTTRVLLERILAQEEEHANDMHDPLVTHEGRPMLER